MNSILEGLNNEQKQAVETLSGPLLIIAGAGSGKTKCLTHRIANLIYNGINGNEILSITFTNKAAEEIKTRVKKLLESTMPTATMPVMGTFHSISARFLRTHIHLLKTHTSSFQIVDTTDTKGIITELLKPYKESLMMNAYEVQSVISTAKNKLIQPHNIHSLEDMYSRKYDFNVLSTLYKNYNEQLIKANSLDFDDLLLYFVRILEEYKDVRDYYNIAFKHLLIDEYQDTNHIQYKLVKLLSEHNNVMAIGDDSQSIYAFRGADFRNILNFENDYKDATIIRLEQNYRSTKYILNAANSLIKHNTEGRKKALWTNKTDADKVCIYEYPSSIEEAESISYHIKEHIKNGGSYKDIAILYRTQALSRGLEEALLRHKIPYVIIGGTRFYERLEVKDILCYLRIIANNRDDIAFKRVVNTPKRGIGDATMDTLYMYSKQYNIALYPLLEHINDLSDISFTRKKALLDMYEVIQNMYQYTANNSYSTLLDALLKAINYKDYLHNEHPEDYEDRYQNVLELESLLMNYDGIDNGLVLFLEEISLLTDADKKLKNDDTVRLMTIHASKGLEFHTVFLPAWEQGIFPSDKDLDSLYDIEEARRLAYVAITRAEKICCMSYAKKRIIYGREQYFTPSRFIKEMDNNAVEHYKYSVYSGYYKDTDVVHKPINTVLEPTNDVYYAPGTKVKHQQFGIGKVLLHSNNTVHIVFEGIGMKKINSTAGVLEVV